MIEPQRRSGRRRSALGCAGIAFAVAAAAAGCGDGSAPSAAGPGAVVATASIEDAGRVRSAVVRLPAGGSDWEVVLALPSSRASALAFVDANDGWVAGVDRLLFRTADGGSTFADRSASLEDQPALTVVLAAAFGDDRHGVVAGGGPPKACLPECAQAPAILFTEDGGRQWRPAAIEDGAVATGRDPVTSVCLTRGGGGVAVVGAVALSTDDFGMSWRRANGAPFATSFSCTGLDDVWTVSSDAAWRSRDGGESWGGAGALPIAGDAIWDASFPEADRGFVCGHAAAGRTPFVLRTNDGGASWVRLDLPSLALRFPPGDVSHLRCSFASAEAGIVFGTFAASGDGGGIAARHATRERSQCVCVRRLRSLTRARVPSDDVRHASPTASRGGVRWRIGPCGIWWRSSWP